MLYSSYLITKVSHRRNFSHVIASRRFKRWKYSYLTGSIDNLGRIFLAFEFDDFRKGVLDSRIVALNKVAVDKLDSERGFSYYAVSKRDRIEVGRRDKWSFHKDA